MSLFHLAGVWWSPHARVFDRGAVGNEDEVVRGDVASSVLSALDPLDPASDLAFRGDVKHDVGDLGVVHNRDALLLEPLDQREDQGVVLVEACELDGAEIHHNPPKCWTKRCM